SGDQFLQAEMKSIFQGNVETAVVKEAIHKWAAKCYPLGKSHAIIEDVAKRAVEKIDSFTPFVLDGPVELEIEWVSTAAAYKASLVPGSYLKNSRTIAYQGETILEAWQGILACLNLGGAAFDKYYG